MYQTYKIYDEYIACPICGKDVKNFTKHKISKFHIKEEVEQNVFLELIKRVKPVTEETIKKRKEDKKIYNRNYMILYYENNPDKYNSHKLKMHESRNENPQLYIERVKESKRKNPEKYGKKNKIKNN